MEKNLSYFFAVVDASLGGENLFERLRLSDGDYVVNVPKPELMRSIIENYNPGYKDFYAYRLHMCALLTQILAIYVECRSMAANHTVAGGLEPVISFMKKNLSRNVSIDELAQTIHMPVSTFKRKFLQTFGLPPMRYFDTLRIEKIVKLIRETDWPISKIAHSMGFENKYYFAKFFSKHLHVSPGEYAEIVRFGRLK